MSFIAGYLLGRASKQGGTSDSDILKKIEALPGEYGGGLPYGYSWSMAVDYQNKIFNDTGMGFTPVTDETTGKVTDFKRSDTNTYGASFLRVYKNNKMIYAVICGSYNWIITSQKLMNYYYYDSEKDTNTPYPEGYLGFSSTFKNLANRTATIQMGGITDEIYVDFKGEYYLSEKYYKPDGSITKESDRLMPFGTFRFCMVRNNSVNTEYVFTALSQAELEKELLNIQKAAAVYFGYLDPSTPPTT